MKTTSSLRIVIFYGLCLALTLTVSCSVLHPTQLTAVESLCERVDTLSFLPQRVLQMIANNRQERNLYFTATLITPQLRVAQLNDMVDSQIKEEKMIKRYLSYSDVLRSYFLALKRLCVPTRYEQYGVELRGVGRSLDSLIHYYNELEGEGYIYWGDMRITVDAEVSSDGDYLEIVLDESIFSATGDNDKLPEIWFELMRDTECIYIGCNGGAYLVAVTDAAE